MKSQEAFGIGACERLVRAGRAGASSPRAAPSPGTEAPPGLGHPGVPPVNPTEPAGSASMGGLGGHGSFTSTGLVRVQRFSKTNRAKSFHCPGRETFPARAFADSLRGKLSRARLQQTQSRPRRAPHAPRGCRDSQPRRHLAPSV